MVPPEPCPGCGAPFPAHDGPTHRYIGASPGCWAAYGELLARAYGDARVFASHRLTVDAYAAQHPGTPTRQSLQSVAVHLIALHLALERGVAPDAITRSMAALVERGGFSWLTPPPTAYATTILEVHGADDPDDHRRRVARWAADVWSAWSAHHATIREWARRGSESGAPGQRPPRPHDSGTMQT